MHDDRHPPFREVVLALAVLAATAALAAPRRQKGPPHAPPAHRPSPPATRFTFTPWQMTTGGGGMPVLLPEDERRPSTGLVMRFDGQVGTRYGKIPPPDSDWRPAPDPSTVRFHKEPTVFPCEKEAVYFYFRTTLNVPPQMNPKTVTLSSSRIDERLLVLVNGTPHPQLNKDDLPLGPVLKPGRNVITAILGDWCIAADFQGVSITGQTRDGKVVTAALRHP